MNKTTAIVLALTLMVLSGGAVSRATDEVRASVDGTIVTSPMLKMKPVYERGVDKLAVVFVPDKKVGASRVGLSAFTNKKYLLDIDTSALDSYTATEFVSRINSGGHVSAEQFSELGNEIDAIVKRHGWTGRHHFAVSSDGVDEKIRQAGHKTLLFIKEIELPDHIGDTNQTLDSKGIYARFDKLYAHAGFLVALIDLETGQQLKHGAYRQASSIQLDGLSWKDSPDEYTEAELEEIATAVRERVEVNIGESLRMLRIVL